MSNKLSSVLISDVFNEEEYGSLNINAFGNKPFVMYAASPFIQPLKWINDREVCRQCKLIVGQYYLPFTHDVSPLWEFAHYNAIQFKNVKLSKSVLDNYVLYKNCVFINLANTGKIARLLLVYIPKGVSVIDFTGDPLVIGMSSNTVNLSGVKSLSLPGKIYGANKYSGLFKQILIGRDTLCYTSDKTAKGMNVFAQSCAV